MRNESGQLSNARPSQHVNAHKYRYKRTRKLLLVACVVWIAMLVGAALLPRGYHVSDLTAAICIVFVVSLFLAIAVLSVFNVVAYMRWTGKYPCYFVVNWLRRRGSGE